jgi:rhodanese-related sulfurtransferase
MDPHFYGVIFQTHARELAKRIHRPFPAYCVLDVRPRHEFAAGHIPGARHASPDELAEGLPAGTEASTEFFVVGAGPEDAAIRPASQALRAAGARRVVEFGGGMSEWRAYGFDVLPEAA